MRDRDKKHKDTDRSGNTRHQSKNVESEKRNLDKYERKKHDEPSAEVGEKTGRRGSKGSKGSGEREYSNQTSKNERDKHDIKTKEDEDGNVVDDSKSNKKNTSKSNNRNRDDRRRTKDYPSEEKVVKSREGNIKNIMAFT